MGAVQLEDFNLHRTGRYNMSWKVGRNDPCPCGSGKKYKKCCGLLGDIRNASLDPFARYNELLTEIKFKLDRYFAGTIKRVRRENLQYFLHYTVNRSLPPEHESLYSDWLWFDRPLPDRPSYAELYLQENAEFMEVPLRECLQALVDSSLSIYHVMEAQDMILKVCDLFTGEEREVLLKEPWQGSLDRPVLILGRLVKIDQGQLFSGMVLLSEDPDGQKAEFLRAHYDYCQQLGLYPAGLPAEVNYGLFDHAHKKKLFSLRDMRSAAVNADTAQNLHRQLAELEQFTLAHCTEQVAWFMPCREHYGYVRVAVGPDFVAAAADVIDDVIYLQQQLTALFPHLKMDLVHSSLRRSHPPADKASIWLTIMKDQHTEIWLDTPHEELEGQTPRQLLDDIEGRKRLLDMLREFSASVQSEDQLEFINFMKARVEGSGKP